MPYDALCVVRARLHARVQSADYGLQTTENNYSKNSTEKKALKNGFILCIVSLFASKHREKDR